MILASLTEQSLAGAPTLIGAVIWTTLSLFLSFHRAGIQIVGGAICLGGIVGFFVGGNFHASCILLFSGALIHLFGRALYRLRTLREPPGEE